MRRDWRQRYAGVTFRSGVGVGVGVVGPACAAQQTAYLHRSRPRALFLWQRTSLARSATSVHAFLSIYLYWQRWFAANGRENNPAGARGGEGLLDLQVTAMPCYRQPCLSGF